MSPNAETAFRTLHALQGRWQAESGDPSLVEYRLSANDSVLVETWTWPDKNIEALTLYHMDDQRLVATHYCPIGNQPRLILASVADGRLTFEFESATNLPDPAVGHCVGFWMEVSPDRLLRSETYVENGAPDTEETPYRRVR